VPSIGVQDIFRQLRRGARTILALTEKNMAEYKIAIIREDGIGIEVMEEYAQTD
jgi:hypothetical protein